MLNTSLSTFPVLTTERLTLRQLVESDAAEIFLLRSDVAINKYLDRPLSKTPEDALDFIKKVINKQLLYWAITETGHNKLVGTICLFNFSEEHKKCEIGYELQTGFQGKGMMTEAMGKIIEFAMQTLELKKIDAVTHKDNIHSIKLLLKFNFTKTEIADGANAHPVAFRLSY